MIDKYFHGKIPAYAGRITSYDGALEQLAEQTVEKVQDAMENMEFSIALAAIWQLISRTNKYIDETQPWMLVKDEQKQAELVSAMVHLAESLRIAAVLLQPFLTRTPAKIWAQLGIAEGVLTDWESVKQFGKIPGGTKVNKGEPIFPRLDVQQEVAYIVQAMGGTVAAAAGSEETTNSAKKEPAPSDKHAAKFQTEINIDEFAKVELRVAQVIAAEPVKNADKLLKLQLDLGTEQRQVVSGIAKYYTPEQLVGQKVICVVNLKPVKLRGELSQGMILAASSGEQLTLATVPEDMPNGAIVK